VIAMMAVGSGASYVISQQIASIGSNIILLIPGSMTSGGLRTGSGALQELALAAAYGFKPRARQASDLVNLYNSCGNLLTFMLRNLFWLPTQPAGKGPTHQPAMLLPDLQISIVRENAAASDRGLILTLKGGHNGENHNHNDVGQFELFSDGRPVIIDVGTAYYGRQNFSDRRYELWYVGAAGHNIPTVNGVAQQEGEQYRASIVTTSNSGMELDLTAAYPVAAGVKSANNR